LRIGLLGASRIADEAIVAPARTLGHELVAVAARDRARAEAFAAQRRIPTVHDSYADVIADPEVDLVYNALVNSLHAQWNITALEAGKHVLSEKPLTSNAEQAQAVRAAARASSGRIVEGFHYLHHPVNQRLGDLITSGALGEIRQVDLVLAIPAPPDTDPRWSLSWPAGRPWTWAATCSTQPASSAAGSTRRRKSPPWTPQRGRLMSTHQCVSTSLIPVG
jgi:predicted dehydrogenase